MLINPVKTSTILFHFVFFVTIFFADESVQKAVFFSHEKLFHDLIGGKGLYDPLDSVFILDSTNFNSSVLQDKDKAWIIKFYNSWCGHCMKYAATWKAFARNIHYWRSVISVGAIDCSTHENGQFCREYEIMAYPTLRLFPPNSAQGFLGDEFNRFFSVSNLRHAAVSALEKLITANQKGKNWPDLKPVANVTEKLVKVSPVVRFSIVVIDTLESSFGAELILDFHGTKEVQVISVLNTNSDFVREVGVTDFPSLLVKERNASKFTSLSVKNNTREDIYNATRKFLLDHDVDVPELMSAEESSNEMNPNRIFDIISQEKNMTDDKVYQLDLEMALRHTLFHELRMRKLIEGDSLQALRRYVRVVARYFPIDSSGREFLQKFSDALWQHEGSLTGEQYDIYLRNVQKGLETSFLQPSGYLNCATSIGKPPCSMWLMFHTLTVQAHSKHRDYSDFDPRDVLNSMHGYVKHFFGCTECSQHFQSMATTIQANVTSFNSSILWLWNAHNKVNARLSNDSIEGSRLKVQFPSSSNCPSCRVDGSWDEEKVLNHLKRIHSKLSYQPLPKPEATDVVEKNNPSNRMNNAVSNDEIGYREEILISSSTNFNLFDLSLCVILYLFSVVVLVLICIKFLVKKNGKKKFYHIHDFLVSRV